MRIFFHGAVAKCDACHVIVVRTIFTILDIKCSKGVHKSDIRTQNHGDVRAKKEHFREMLLLYYIVKKVHLNVTANCGMHVVDIHHLKTPVNADLNGLGSGYGKKRILCIWWDLEGVMYHELLKSSETVNSARCQK
ncbi:hypothetical protein AVEN_78874-1 [Araneus ventricosus]|uniref:Uncharacterized protein n=1 Tax=Araneus ventricosus TaxID=182803 RepID=A0A4Y2G1F5_ARAVE|nr:hypothetical protein AVEN_78874-1 [Araneus ventricosus]